MKKEIPFYSLGNEPFIAGSLSVPFRHKRLYKIGSAGILFCIQGQAQVTIDLKTHTISSHSVLFLLPETIISMTEVSSDFSLSYFICSADMFWETVFRLNTQFLHFLKIYPSYRISPERIGSVEGLMKASVSIYTDRDNRFRYQIAKNLLHNFLLDTCDKIYRRFSIREIEGHNRRDELFRGFIDLLHKHCSLQHEVTFYANALCISTKYLSDICRLTTGNSPKKLIDNFVMLEIKLLLQSTDLSLQEISDRLNFPDQSYLGRYFKHHSGISPTEYRKEFIK